VSEYVQADLVPGRDCGACTACCTELTVETSDIRKVQGVTCVHCTAGAGCGIYLTRPEICRTWFCQWRRYAWLDDAWRPDLSQMILRATDDDVPDGYASEIGIVFDLFGPCDVLLLPATLDVIARLIDADIATFLSVPGLVGWASGRVLLNPSLEAAVRERDGDKVRARMVDAFLMSALHPKVPIEL